MDELKARLAAATATLEDVRSEFHRQITMSKIAIAVALAAAVVGGLVNFVLILKVWGQSDQIIADRTAARVTGCERDNRVRADTLAGFDQFTDQIAGLGNQPTDPAAIRARAELVATFKKQFKDSLPNLAPRDCDPEVLNTAATAQ